MVNGPECGIRQEDPLAQYLFISVAQTLFDELAELASDNICKGIIVSPFSPSISHLLFEDDYFFILWNMILSMHDV